MSRQISHRSVVVDGVNIFYREAGDSANPSLLLLHGFPSSSVMFKVLMTALSDRFHLIAPDYPAFGFSDIPDKSNFEYTFNNVSAYINRFTEEIKLKSFTIFLHDYGSLIGLRLCVNHPEKIEGIIVMNGNAYQEGAGESWNEIRDYWEHPTEEKKKKVYAFLSEEGTKDQYTAGLPEHLLPNVSPELWMLDWALLKRDLDTQYVLNCDLKSNMDMYPVYQQYFREHQPPALVIWGKYDPYFSVEEAPCYKRDLPDAQIHILEGSHMLLETNFEEVVGLIDEFMTAPSDL